MAWTDADGTFHEDALVEVQLGYEPAGEFQLDPGNYPGLSYMRFGTAYFCPHCGAVWARLRLWREHGVAPYEAVSIACSEHEDAWNTPGSLIPVGLEGLLALLPPALIRREFDLEIQQWIRKHSNG